MTTDLRSLKVSCHTKFRVAEREAQCILGECGPLTCRFFALSLLNQQVEIMIPIIGFSVASAYAYVTRETSP